MIYHNGDVYVGNWREDKKDGIGEFISHTGEISKGEFLNDKFMGGDTDGICRTQ
jgi:hypothetical protein